MKETTTKTTKATTNKATTAKTVKQLSKPVVTKEMASKPILSETDKILADQKKFLETKTKVIRKEMGNVEKAFIRIGYELQAISTVYNAKKFKAIGYKDIYDYAQKEFNIARGTCSDFINIIEHFAKRDEHGHILPELDEKYKAFSSSKLSVMITMSDDALNRVQEYMTVKDLKILKKGYEPSTKPDKTADKASEEVPDDIVIDDDNYEVSNVVISFRTVEEYNKNIDRLDDLILRCLKAGHKVTVSETVKKVRTSEQ